MMGDNRISMVGWTRCADDSERARRDRTIATAGVCRREQCHQGRCSMITVALRHVSCNVRLLELGLPKARVMP